MTFVAIFAKSIKSRLLLTDRTCSEEYLRKICGHLSAFAFDNLYQHERE